MCRAGNHLNQRGATLCRDRAVGQRTDFRWRRCFAPLCLMNRAGPLHPSNVEGGASMKSKSTASSSRSSCFQISASRLSRAAFPGETVRAAAPVSAARGTACRPDFAAFRKSASSQPTAGWTAAWGGFQLQPVLQRRRHRGYECAGAILAGGSGVGIVAGIRI